jgi:hypothetical protein
MADSTRRATSHLSQDADLQEDGKSKRLLECRRHEGSTESMLVVKMSVREAASMFNLPNSSLQDRILKIRSSEEYHLLGYDAV